MNTTSTTSRTQFEQLLVCFGGNFSSLLFLTKIVFKHILTHVFTSTGTHFQHNYNFKKNIFALRNNALSNECYLKPLSLTTFQYTIRTTIPQLNNTFQYTFRTTTSALTQYICNTTPKHVKLNPLHKDYTTRTTTSALTQHICNTTPKHNPYC